MTISNDFSMNNGNISWEGRVPEVKSSEETPPPVESCPNTAQQNQSSALTPDTGEDTLSAAQHLLPLESRLSTRLLPLEMFIRYTEQQAYLRNAPGVFSSPFVKPNAQSRQVPLPGVSREDQMPFYPGFRDQAPQNTSLLEEALYTRMNQQRALYSRQGLTSQLHNRVYPPHARSVLTSDPRSLVQLNALYAATPTAMPPSPKDEASHQRGKSTPRKAKDETSSSPAGPDAFIKGKMTKTTDQLFNKTGPTSIIASARKECEDQSLSGRKPMVMYMECDDEHLTEYQCFLRKNIEIFEATEEDLQWNAQRMNRSVVLGQVGIRCRYCATKLPWARPKGAVYYSANLEGLYQAGQNMSKNHLCLHCTSIPADVKQKMIYLKDEKRRAGGGGKEYWSVAIRVLGVYKDRYGLRFK